MHFWLADTPLYTDWGSPGIGFLSVYLNSVSSLFRYLGYFPQHLYHSYTPQYEHIFLSLGDFHRVGHIGRFRPRFELICLAGCRCLVRLLGRGLMSCCCGLGSLCTIPPWCTWSSSFVCARGFPPRLPSPLPIQHFPWCCTALCSLRRRYPLRSVSVSCFGFWSRGNFRS